MLCASFQMGWPAVMRYLMTRNDNKSSLVSRAIIIEQPPQQPPENQTHEEAALSTT